MDARHTHLKYAIQVAWSWFAWMKWNPANDAAQAAERQSVKADSYVQLLVPRHVLEDEEDTDAEPGHVK